MELGSHRPHADAGSGSHDHRIFALKPGIRQRWRSDAGKPHRRRPGSVAEQKGRPLYRQADARRRCRRHRRDSPLINDLADRGAAVVVVSSYLPEIMTLSDRILVCRQGRIVEELDAAEATEQKIIYAAVH
jgi:hypothetical protein